MATTEHRSVRLERVDEGVYRATNPRGGEMVFGSNADDGFTPVELLLAAIAGCAAVDVDVVTSRHAEPDEFSATASGDVVRGDTGNVTQNLTVRFNIAFPAGAEGDKARHLLPRALRASTERSCTVSRTIEAGEPVTFHLEG